MIFKGRIEAKKLTQEGTGVKGAWQRWVFTIDGKDYSTFEKKIYGFFQVGDYIQIETKTEGKYENMVKMEKAAAEPFKEQIQAFHGKDGGLSPSPPINIKPEFHQSPEACRYEAMECALKWKPNATADEIFIVAQRFLNWILEGK